MNNEDVFEEEGMLWPPHIKPTAVADALRKARVIKHTVSHCERRRTVVQAGAMNGLWPIRFADHFEQVCTFEAEPLMADITAFNIAASGKSNIRFFHCALGDKGGECAMERRSLGSHTVIEGGAGVQVWTLDSLWDIAEVDLIQLDIEGYEAKALRGAVETIKLWRPVIQLEWKGFTTKYGDTPEQLRAFLDDLGYSQAAILKGGDLIFKHRG
jgi:FkbM family methyltransferase